MYLFNTFFYEPLFNFLVAIYNFIPGHDIGLAIIVLTIAVKLALYPLSQKSIKAQKSLQDLQPKVEALKAKYKGQKEKLASEMMGLYKTEKANPFSSCLPLLIQFPFLIAIYWVFRNGLTAESLDFIYPFISNPGQLNPVAFGFLNLSDTNILLALMAGAAQFWQVKMLSSKKPGIKSKGSKDENMMSSMNKQMMYFMPIITIVIGLGLPGGLMLYWTVTALFTVFQQKLVFKKESTISPKIEDAPKTKPA